eukprot:gene1838-2068_t
MAYFDKTKATEVITDALPYGQHNPSDFLSRHPLADSQEVLDNPALISAYTVPKAMNLAEIQAATQQDATLQYLITLIRDHKRWDFLKPNSVLSLPDSATKYLSNSIVVPRTTLVMMGNMDFVKKVNRSPESKKAHLGSDERLEDRKKFRKAINSATKCLSEIIKLHNLCGED